MNTGKESKTAVAFNEDGWGKATTGSTQVAARIAETAHKFERIEREALLSARASTGVVVSLVEGSTQNSTDADEWTMMVDAYDSDDDSTYGRDDD